VWGEEEPMGRTGRQWAVASAVLVFAAAVQPAGLRGETIPVEELRRQMEAMRAQLQKMQDQIQKQQELIDRMSREKGKPMPATAAGAAPPPTVSAEEEERIKRQVTEQVMRRMQPSLAAANKTFPSQFNPAIGLIIDNVGSYSSKDRGNFEFRAAELGLSASVDPFARGYAIITGSSNGFDVEEAAIVTTSLPYNLTAKGGRFFADFGRLSKFHDHDLPFVNRPIVLDRFVNGESQADGVEVDYLVPTASQYLTLTGGWYNKMGAENERVSNEVPRDLSEFTYLGRAATFFSLNDANSIDLGTSYAYTPEVKIENDGARHLAGVDLTYRYTPLSQASYRGFIWGTEALYNVEDRPVGGSSTEAADTALSRFARTLGDPLAAPPQPVPFATAASTPSAFKRRESGGLYSYVEARLTRRFYPGFLFDWSQDIDHVGGDTLAYSPYLTVWASEFQRLRLQYTRLEAPGDHDNQFFLQWTVILGSHVHGFKDR
jgi:hypothetical protein